MRSVRGRARRQTQCGSYSMGVGLTLRIVLIRCVFFSCASDLLLVWGPMGDDGGVDEMGVFANDG